jgi:hypothetical protein
LHAAGILGALPLWRGAQGVGALLHRFPRHAQQLDVWRRGPALARAILNSCGKLLNLRLSMGCSGQW